MAAFDYTDYNKDGQITKQELAKLYIDVGSPLDENTLTLVYSVLDFDGNKKIDINDWCNIQQFQTTQSL